MWSGGKLGLAFYVIDSAHLHVMSDVTETDDFCLLRRGQQHILSLYPLHLLFLFLRLQFSCKYSQGLWYSAPLLMRECQESWNSTVRSRRCDAGIPLAFSLSPSQPILTIQQTADLVLLSRSYPALTFVSNLSLFLHVTHAYHTAMPIIPPCLSYCHAHHTAMPIILPCLSYRHVSPQAWSHASGVSSPCLAFPVYRRTALTRRKPYVSHPTSPWRAQTL